MSCSRIYVYKLVADNGGAPCIHRGLLSLAICKPKIRATARQGDYIVGFGGQRLGQRVIYAAKITSKPAKGDYYISEQFSKRPDCIYRNADGVAVLKVHPKFHSDGQQLRRDVGGRFGRADVLLSDDFIYFGSKDHRAQESRYPTLIKMLQRLRQGHRVNHNAMVQSELEELIAELWSLAKRGAVGRPSDGDCTLRCNQDAE